jgi:hypothetical protein
MFLYLTSRRMRWVGLLHIWGEDERCTQSFGGGKPKGNRQIGGPRRRWEDNRKIDLQEVECGEHGLD